MYRIAESGKSFKQPAANRNAAVRRTSFGVVHVLDLRTTPITDKRPPPCP